MLTQGHQSRLYIFTTCSMVQSLMQNFLTALKLLHLHQQLSQIITQEVKLLSLQGCFIVTYRLCNIKCKSA